MAKIILGMGTSHGPMLSTPPEQWGARVPADRTNTHPFRDGTYSYDALCTLRAGENLGEQITPDVWKARHDGCQTALDRLSDIYRQASPDVAVIIGNDQMEMIVEENMPAITVYWGDTIENVPFTEEQEKMMPPGIAIAASGHHPPEPATYPGLPALGRHVIECLIDAEFDVASSNRIPAGAARSSGVAHAYGFVYRQIMKDAVIPNVPVILNTFYPPNQPTAKRCHDLGKALARAIESWYEDKTVAIFASGGLSHFVIDEELDRRVVDAMLADDANTLRSIPEYYFQSGTSEIKNWIPLTAAMAHVGLKMDLVDYIPCYRSEAGTGNAMCFAHWQ